MVVTIFRIKLSIFILIGAGCVHSCFFPNESAADGPLVITPPENNLRVCDSALFFGAANPLEMRIYRLNGSKAKISITSALHNKQQNI